MPAGIFDFEGKRRVFVSRGVGSILDMRFFCSPEINIISIGAE
jgi:predicted MPP superfamily phosphohydrolase